MARSVKFTDGCWKDYQEWAEDKKTLKNVNVHQVCAEDPERWIGRPARIER